MTSIEEYGCAHCFAAVYHPTSDEKRSGICQDCTARALSVTVLQWHTAEVQHAAVPAQD